MSTPRWAIIYPAADKRWYMVSRSFRVRHGDRWKDYLYDKEEGERKVAFFHSYGTQGARLAVIKLVKSQIVKDWYRGWSRGLT